MGESNLLEPPARVALFVSCAVLIGLPLSLRMVVLPAWRDHGLDASPSHTRARARSRAWLTAAAAGVIFGAVALFVAQTAPLDLGFTALAEWLDFAQQTSIGHMMLARVALGGLAMSAFVLSARPGIWLGAGALAGVLAQASITRTSHSASSGDALAMAADFAHLAAGALWGGGLVVILIAVRAMCASMAADSDAGAVASTRAIIRRFSPIGMAGVALATATGLVLSARHVPSARDVLSSAFGAVLAAKVALVIAAVAVAGAHKFVTARHMRAPGDVRRFARTLAAEVLLVAGVFAMAAALTSLAPPAHVRMHAMADGSSHMLTATDPDFGRWLMVAALAITTTGAVACALEWRARPLSQS